MAVEDAELDVNFKDIKEMSKSRTVLPWHTIIPIHLQGLLVQLDGVLLSPLGCHPCLKPFSDGCCGNQGLQDHWNLQ